MVAPIITHVIGITALLAIMMIIIMYVGFMTQTMMYENVKKNLEMVSQSLAMQIYYGISSDTNMSLQLDYPLIVGKNTFYNIYIANTSYILGVAPFLSDKLQPSQLYVLVMTPDKQVYAYTPVCNITFNGKTILVQNNMIVIGSGTAATLAIEINSTNIYITIYKIEVRYP